MKATPSGSRLLLFIIVANCVPQFAYKPASFVNCETQFTTVSNDK